MKNQARRASFVFWYFRLVFDRAPLRLSHIPWPQEVRAFAKR
jgi:hypothetical protein